MLCCLPAFLTKEFISQQGKGKIAAETYQGTFEQAILPLTQLRDKFRSYYNLCLNDGAKVYNNLLIFYRYQE